MGDVVVMFDHMQASFPPFVIASGVVALYISRFSFLEVEHCGAPFGGAGLLDTTFYSFGHLS